MGTYAMTDHDLKELQKRAHDEIRAAHLSAMCSVAGSMAAFFAVTAVVAKDPEFAADSAGKMLSWQLFGPLLLAGMDPNEAMIAAGIKETP